MKNIIFATNAQKILDFLLKFPDKEYLEKEIQKRTGISKAGVNLAVKELYKTGFVKKVKRGKISFYNLNSSLAFIKQLKIVNIIHTLSALVKKLSKLSSKIILYGSCGRGEDNSGSDIDLLVITHMPDEVEKQINDSSLSKKVKAIIRTPLKFVEMEQKEPVFYKEIDRGITLWESKDEF